MTVKALITKYDRQVPRYTSYPTTPQFSSKVNGAVYKKWLANCENSEAISLYFHIPFCSTLCWFCGCHTQAVRRYQTIQEYVPLLVREIETVTKTLPSKKRVQHIHFGGGSPSLLQKNELFHILDTVRHNFSLENDAEIAIELEPRSIDIEIIQSYAKAGINRVSLGIQDLTPKVQEAINRIQTFEETQNLVETLRAEGINSINIDLMYGLPHQTVDSLLHSFEQVLSLAPNRISLFGYAHVPWMKPSQKKIDETVLPNSAERLFQFEAVATRLKELGFVSIGLDHFARRDDEIAKAYKEKKLQRNFQGYTTDRCPVLLGFGASAIGYLEEGYIQNERKLSIYRDTITHEGVATSKGIILSDDDRLRREIIQKLMCYHFVDLDEIAKQHKIEPSYFSNEWNHLLEMEEEGLLSLDGGSICLTEKNRSYVRVVAALFDPYLRSEKTRHSRSI